MHTTICACARERKREVEKNQRQFSFKEGANMSLSYILKTIENDSCEQKCIKYTEVIYQWDVSLNCTKIPANTCITNVTFSWYLDGSCCYTL